MSRSRDSKGKPPGFDYWSKRTTPKVNKLPVGPEAKRETAKAERRKSKDLIEKELHEHNFPEHYERCTDCYGEVGEVCNHEKCSKCRCEHGCWNG